MIDSSKHSSDWALYTCRSSDDKGSVNGKKDDLAEENKAKEPNSSASNPEAGRDVGIDLDFTALDYEAMDAAHSDNEADKLETKTNEHSAVQQTAAEPADSDSSDSSGQGMKGIETWIL